MDMEFVRAIDRQTAELHRLREAVDEEGAICDSCGSRIVVLENALLLAGRENLTSVGQLLAKENAERGEMLTLQDVADAVSALLEQDIPDQLRPGASVGAMILRRLSELTPIARDPVLRG